MFIRFRQLIPYRLSPMASEQGMSGIDVRAMASELREKLPLWVDKVYQFDSRTMAIRLNGENKAKYLVLIEAGRRIHVVRSIPEPPKNPPHFAMFLRKYLSGGKVLSIRQQGLNRVIIFEIGKGTTTYNLIIELFDEGNVILTDPSFTILKPLRHHRFKDREVIPGVPYVTEAADPTVSAEAVATFLKSDDRELVKALAIGCMLGGTYAEFICSRAGQDKSMPASQANPARISNSLQDVFRQIDQDRHPVIATKHCEPIDIWEGTVAATAYPTFSEALETFYPLTKKERKATSRPKIEKTDRIRMHQEAAVRKFDRTIAQTEEIVNSIYENYQTIAQIIATLDTASKSYSWQEIEKRIRETPSPEARKIITFYPAEAAVDVDIGKRVKIFVHESLEQNAGRYHDLIKKFKRKKAGALTAMAAFVPKKETKKRDFIPLKKLWYHRFRWFITSDGVVVLGGRDASQNEELVKKYMAGGDLFVHADVHGASVVLVKGKTEHMDEVAQFAASYSGAWRSGHFSADVYTALPPQVSKTPEAGEFVTRGSFIVRGERTYYRNVPLSIGIGLMIEPNAAVIGGPVSAIKDKVKFYVELKPGQYEPNDAAKKVLRILKEKIPDDDVKALKGILNTERVAAFTPPGGSDIVGHHEG